ncbi:PREDICTED: protein unzipped [Eufriesea mexicana]|uniref:protein unzipped n=1 Tax=Eufriesea mexicana TaxID=516756 RepID=UPI00083C77E0|nr:PREDICTED: protein unzipped [Eufriesea mexicana]XP_017752377.1 PREDICTED: protein unzipped [Eufriesea mexicana]XP_017752378.1 PREDICTED: protein unzipped [Eufriesea mexicana]
MSWQRIYVTVGLFVVLLLLANADNSVHILSKYQLITSTTLNWLPRAHYDPSKEIVIGGFEIEESEDDSYNNQAEKSERKRPLYVCRALHTTVWVAGSQRGDEQRCTVTIHDNVQSYDKYELLENVDNAARVNWEYWDKYRSTPLGAVAMEKMFVARHAAENDKNKTTTGLRYTHYIGTLTTHNILGSISYVKDDGTEGTARHGDVLVETEPIYYDLTRVKLNWPKKRVIKRTPRVLGEATITNNGPEAANMAQAFAYTYKYSMYWGQGHAILKGLNTSITLTNGTALPKIMWGTKETTNPTDVYTVEVYLEPGTGVNVTLRANYTDMEVPYTGTLISHYEDGETKSRVINGIRMEETMFDIKPEFGSIYFLGNYSLVPTTTVPTTTEPSTTAIPQNVSKVTRHDHDTENEDHDENMIVPPKKSDMSNMQSDDGGPLSLKNKVEVTHSGTSLLRLNGILVISLTFIVHRIT